MPEHLGQSATTVCDMCEDGLFDCMCIGGPFDAGCRSDSVQTVAGVDDRMGRVIKLLHGTSEDQEKHELLDAISTALDILTGQEG